MSMLHAVRCLRAIELRVLVLRVLALVPMLLGTAVLLGWALDVEALRYLSPLSDQPRIKANTAVCIVVLSIALVLLLPRSPSPRRVRVAAALSVLVCCIAGLTLAEHVLGIDASIDQLLVREQPGAARTPHLGRMAANTALALLLLGVALLLFEVRWRGRRPANLLAAVAGVLGVIALDGIVLNVDAVPVFSQYARMAGATAIALVLLAFGIILARRETVAGRLLGSSGPAGVATRRLIPAVVGVPAVVGFLCLEGQRRGLYGLELGTWLLVISLTTVLGVIAWRLIRRLDAAERRSREAEQQTLAALALAERANAAKSEFISRMSHELRTPMNSVLGFAQLMEMDGVADHHEEHVGHILRSGRHLLGLINEILDLSRIEAGMLSISQEPVDVHTAVCDCVSLMQPLAAEHGITLAVATQPDLTCVMADDQRLRQVLLNLLANAVKYNTPAGRVTVSWQRSADVVRIGVRDTGIGIPPERLPMLFEPFERLGAETGTAEGTGLGLALCRRLVALMGGSIEVAGEDGGGTTFTVVLAIADPLAGIVATTTPGAPVDRALDERALQIVYIEDNATNLRLVETVLAPYGATVHWAGAVGDGVDLVARQQPDVVLLDLHLRDGSGFDALERLQAQPETARIPVIVLTADATTGAHRRARELGAQDFLAKPLDVELLLSAVTRVVSRTERDVSATAAHASRR